MWLPFSSHRDKPSKHCCQPCAYYYTKMTVSRHNHTNHHHPPLREVDCTRGKQFFGVEGVLGVVFVILTVTNVTVCFCASRDVNNILLIATIVIGFVRYILEVIE